MLTINNRVIRYTTLRSRPEHCLNIGKNTKKLRKEKKKHAILKLIMHEIKKDKIVSLFTCFNFNFIPDTIVKCTYCLASIIAQFKM